MARTAARLVSCLLAALALAACSGPDAAKAPFAESRTPAQLGDRFYPPEGWTWGWVQVGEAGPQRYGVSAPAGAPQAQLLILPDYGETAETWFETARDLNDLGYTVWVLEGAGQGGSARIARERDLGHLHSFEPDAAAVRAMDSVVIRPSEGAPLIIVGQGVGGLVAALSVEGGERPRGLVLSSPDLGDGGADPALGSAGAGLLGLGVQRAPGGSPWRRDGKNDLVAGRTHDPWRGGATHAWQLDNPDLRMGGPSVDWLQAFGRDAARARARLAGVDVDTLVIEGDQAGGCRVLVHCHALRLQGGGRALELERDQVRGAWLDAVDRFARGRIAGPGA